MQDKKAGILSIVFVMLIGAAFVVAMNYWFDASPSMRDIFSGGGGDVMGEVAPNSEASIAMQTRLAAKISMLIFSIITALQLLAFGVGSVVISGIRRSSEPPKIKLERLVNADIFFDVPLYVGLFGTVSAFLVMTFSPQSSRLIAYSSTLIGIVFSLILRLAMQYPMRQRLLTERQSGDSRK